jgi:hypothetical protein
VHVTAKPLPYAIGLCLLLQGCAWVVGSTLGGAIASVSSQPAAKCKPQAVAITPGVKHATAPFWIPDWTSTKSDRVYYATFTAEEVVNSKVLGDFRESRRRFVEKELQARGICLSEVKLYGPDPVRISDGDCGVEHALVECEDAKL